MNAMLDFLAGIFRSLGWLEWLFLLMLSFAAIVLWRAHRGSSKFNLEHLVVDPSTGSIVLEKFTLFGAFIISSWGFVALTFKNSLTEWYFLGYMAAWAATRSFTGWLHAKKTQQNVLLPPPPPPQ